MSEIPLKSTLELQAQYGIAAVLCLLMVGILVWVLKWVFDTSKEREKSLSGIINTSLPGLAASQTELAKAITANTTAINQLQMDMRESSKYHRQEHEQILSKINSQ